MAKPELLLVDDDEALLVTLERALRSDYRIRTARSRREARERLATPPDIVLLDLRLDPADPRNTDGLELLDELRERLPELPVLMLTAFGDVNTAVDALQRGAADFLQKPEASVREIRARLGQALKRARRLSRLAHELRLIEPREIVGRSPGILKAMEEVRAVAEEGSVTVLIRGETGTGKELLARSIHASGRRQAGEFVAVPLVNLPEQMVEAELFGYERGAYTGAEARHIGHLERADEGVLFLDEIGDIGVSVQKKLLRFLEEREFQRLGGTKPIRVDTQVVAATNADLATETREGRFREDLYYRLKVYEIAVPPLRERREDVPLLVDHFLASFRDRGRRIRPVGAAAMKLLARHPWPGNVRQLKNALDAALFDAERRGHDAIEPDDLPREIGQPESVSGGGSLAQPGDDAFDLQRELGRIELGYVRQALSRSGGRKTEAGELLGLKNRFALGRRVKRILGEHETLAEEFPDLAEQFPVKKVGNAS